MKNSTEQLMDYKEAEKHYLTVKQKTKGCADTGCWCMMIEPEKELRDKDNNEIYAVK